MVNTLRILGFFRAGVTACISLLAFSTGAQPACVTPPEGLVGWWRAEGQYNSEDNTQIAQSALGVTFAPGAVGSAFQFNGSSRVDLGDPPSLAFTNSFTIESWIWVNSFPTSSQLYGQILFRGDTRFCQDPYYFAVASSGRLKFHIEDQPQTFPCGLDLESSPISLSQWTHVAAVFDADAMLMQIFVNGRLAAEQPCPIRPFKNLTGGGVSVGNHSPGVSTQPFNGLIDELAIYHRALTPSEIESIHAAGGAGKCASNTPSNCLPAADGLVGWWRGETQFHDTIAGLPGKPVTGLTFALGKVGSAFRFSGRSKVELGNPVSLAFTNSFTIQSWIWIDAPPSASQLHAQIFFRGDTRGCLDPYYLAVSPSGAVRFHIDDGKETYPCGLNLETSALPLRQWKHVAAIFDADAKMMQIYVDGEIRAQTSCSIRPFSQLIGGGVAIGNHSLGLDTQPFSGLIDELAVYTRALSPGEIMAIYAAGSGGVCAQSPLLVTQPMSQKVTLGSKVTFSVAARGTPNLRYQWHFNADPIPNATGSTLEFLATETSQGKYSVLVTNTLGAALSDEASLSVNHTPVADAGATTPVAISGNNTNTILVLNGTLSTDSDGDPLQYSWHLAGDSEPIATGVVATVKLPVGVSQISLTVNDGLVSSTDTIIVEVITAADAVNKLIAVAESNQAKPNPLIAILKAALASLDRSNLTSALQQLQAFQNQIRTRVLPLDAELAKVFLDQSQAVIDAIQDGSKSAHGRIEQVVRAINGKIMLNGHLRNGTVLFIEASADLKHWEKIGVITGNITETFNFEDATSLGRTHRYYRLVPLPE